MAITKQTKRTNNDLPITA